VIPGHGDEHIAKQREVGFPLEAHEKVAKLKRQGRTLEEVITAKPTAPYDAEWGQSFQSPKSVFGMGVSGRLKAEHRAQANPSVPRFTLPSKPQDRCLRA